MLDLRSFAELCLDLPLQSVPVASFASSILSSNDHPSLVIGALQLVDLLLNKVPSLYKPTFRREGVFHEIETLAERTLISSIKSKDKDKESSEAPSPESGAPLVAPSPVSMLSIPGFKRLSSLSLEPDDAITLRARVIRFKYLTGDENPEGDSAFDTLRVLVDRIAAKGATEKEVSDALRELADLFASPHTSVSSFELLQSGLVDGLLQFATDQERNCMYLLTSYIHDSMPFSSGHQATERHFVGCIHRTKGKSHRWKSNIVFYLCQETTGESNEDGVV